MQLRYAVLSDFANVTQDGKVNIIGLFDTLYSLNFPAVHRSLCLITSLRSEPDDDNQTRDIKVDLIDEDGLSLATLNGALSLGRGRQVVNQIHVFHDLRFSKPGRYQFTIFLDGLHAKTVDLELVQSRN